MITFTMLCGYVACLFLAILGGIILKMIWTGQIDLSGVLSEANGQASMSRLQLLIFTFVIAISLFMLVERNGTTFPPIPDGVLTLLGISASTYAVGKGISYSRDEGVATPEERDKSRETLKQLDPQAQVAAVKSGNTSV
jgi:hypothetical protein